MKSENNPLKNFFLRGLSFDLNFGFLVYKYFFAMSNRRFYFHLVLFIAALLVGSLSLWHSGIWLDEISKVPNFTAIAMVLLIIGQGGLLLSGHKKNRS